MACVVDGRSVHAELTSEGKAVLDAVMPGYYRMVKDLFSPFNAEFMDNTIALLEGLRTRLEESDV